MSKSQSKPQSKSQSKSHMRGFTLAELLVVLAAVGVLMVVMPVAFSVNQPRHRGVGPLKESVNLRNIHAAMATYAASNKDWFPGLTSKGDYISAKFQGKYYSAMPNARSAEDEKNGAGCTLSAGANLALAQLLEEGAITPAQMISPGETNATSHGETKPLMAEVTAASSSSQSSTAAEPMGDMTSDASAGEVKNHHSSFAMLAYGRDSLKSEWKANQNQQAIVLGTRLIFGNSSTQTPGAFNSVWTDEGSGTWKGSLVRGDTSTYTEVFASGKLDDVFGALNYGGITVKSPQTESAKAIGVFGKSSDMGNFDASEKTGMIGSVLD